MIKRLFFDIETSPNIGLFWEAGYKKNIDYSNIIKERAIICICYKWQGEKITHGLHWDSKQDDKRMLIDFIKIANSADELVGHNGDRFDLAWIRTRCLFHGIDMFPSYTTIDTLKVARSKFRFNSNKLNYIAKFLGIGQKIQTDFNLWKGIVLEKDKEAMDKMVKYCKNDVILLEKVFSHLSVHIEPKTNVNSRLEDGRGNCPECGSNHIRIQQTKYVASGYKKVIYQCKSCYKYHNKKFK
jgi:DNA polymerase elongation subunit (family B)